MPLRFCHATHEIILVGKTARRVSTLSCLPERIRFARNGHQGAVPHSCSPPQRMAGPDTFVLRRSAGYFPTSERIWDVTMFIPFAVVAGFLLLIALSGIRIAQEYERAVVFRLGRF